MDCAQVHRCIYLFKFILGAAFSTLNSVASQVQTMFCIYLDAFIRIVSRAIFCMGVDSSHIHKRFLFEKPRCFNAFSFSMRTI